MRKSIKILLIFLVIMAVGIGGYFVYKEFFTKDIIKSLTTSSDDEKKLPPPPDLSDGRINFSNLSKKDAKLIYGERSSIKKVYMVNLEDFPKNMLSLKTI